MEALGGTAFVFVLVFWVMMLIPCIGIGWMGKKLIDQLGRYPSRTPAVQMSVLVKLVVLEVVSFTLLAGFLKALSVE